MRLLSFSFLLFLDEDACRISELMLLVKFLGKEGSMAKKAMRKSATGKKAAKRRPIPAGAAASKKAIGKKEK